MAEEKKVRSQIHFRITPEEAAIIEQKLFPDYAISEKPSA